MPFVNPFSALEAILLKMENKSVSKEEFDRKTFYISGKNFSSIVYNLHFVISSFAYEKRKQCGLSNDFL